MQGYFKVGNISCHLVLILYFLCVKSISLPCLRLVLAVSLPFLSIIAPEASCSQEELATHSGNVLVCCSHILLYFVEALILLVSARESFYWM